MSNIEVAFTGRLAADPEQRTSKAGNVWARFSVAVGEGDDTQWVQGGLLQGNRHTGPGAAAQGRPRLHGGQHPAQTAGRRRTARSAAGCRCRASRSNRSIRSATASRPS
jgi:hypothetical protein